MPIEDVAGVQSFFRTMAVSTGNEAFSQALKLLTSV